MASVTFKLILYLTIVSCIIAKKFNDTNKPEWAKKDVREYTDEDLERLLEQWEEDEEPEDIPEYTINPEDPENEFAHKKGQMVMVWVTVSGKPTRKESEDLTQIWQDSLAQNYIQVQRYMVDDRQALFVFKDGQDVGLAKDYLLEQERCLWITIDKKKYPGYQASKESTHTEEL